MLIDAHHHLWDPVRRDYPWLSGPQLAPIRRSYGPEDLLLRTSAAGVDATVLVQTVSDVAETEEFLAVAADPATPVAGVVGWVDLTDPAVADEIARLRSGPGGAWLVGVRHQVQDEPDTGWLLRDDVRRGIAAVGEAGLVYDLLVLTHQLDAAAEVAASNPDVTFVLDHGAKPPIADGGWRPWADAIAQFGRLGNVACKVSGLVTEARWDDWSPATLQPYIEHLLAVFDPDRLLFGSDWPVCELAGSYGQVLAAARQILLPHLSPGQADQVFGGNAQRLYRLGVGRAEATADAGPAVAFDAS